MENGFIKMPTAREMGEWDKAAMEFGIPEEMLMNNAGYAVIQAIGERFGDIAQKTFALFMGAGNNGGDAAVMARYIIDAGGKAEIFSLKSKQEIKGAAAFHLDLAIKNGALFHCLDLSRNNETAQALYQCAPDFLADGLLGTGFHGSLRESLASLIELINKFSANCHTPVIAIDIPSGLNAFTGLPSPIAIKANMTVTLAAPKPGIMLPHAAPWTGDIICRDIGIPKTVLDKAPALWHLLDGRALLNMGISQPDSYKNLWGHTYIFGGSGGHTGAAHFSAVAALRAGAGLVSACAPANALAQIKGDWAEIMTLSAGDGNDWPDAIPPNIDAALQSADTLVIGPGMGTGEQAQKFCAKLLACKDRPNAVIDADALTILSKNSALLADLRAEDVLTPHPGEAARLLKLDGKEIQANRFAALEKLCDLTPAIVVLKGAATIIGQKNGKRYLCPYDIPQLAIGGAGDVLSGCIAAFIGRKTNNGYSAMKKVCQGVILHALAGLKLAGEFPVRGYLAGELANELPHVYSWLEASKNYISGSLPWPK